MKIALWTMPLRQELDVVTARRQAQHVAARLGFAAVRQAQIATAVSEIARNTVKFGGGGTCEFAVDLEQQPACFTASLQDSGPGMPDPAQTKSFATGLGLVSARRLADDCLIQSAPGRGTLVQLRFDLPDAGRALGIGVLNSLASELRTSEPVSAEVELQEQNRTLLGLLDQLAQAETEIADLNRELENTNRGVVALYAELDERAERLRQADEVKTRFFSHMSHEFRTPVNAILALSQLLLDRVDGELNAEQSKQVTFIRKAALDLGDLVADLLDLAKVEAGRVTLRRELFEVRNLFGTLRGLMRPLATNPAVTLLFVEPVGLPPVFSDESKVAQILRNFISNALKFTELGEVRVSAALRAESHEVVFSVADSGIGIASADQERVFQEFGQVDHPIQARVKGTGLGLPLSRRLAELLGGRIELKSAPERGSTFSLCLPTAGLESESPRPGEPGQTIRPEIILIVDDDEIARYLLRGMLASQPAQIIEAANGREALRAAGETAPDLILLDLIMPEMTGYEVLELLRSAPATQNVPVIVFTASTLTDAQRAVLERNGVIDIVPKELATRDETQRRLDLARGKARAAGRP